MGLGINKDLEPLAREVRRRGGLVTVAGSNHVRWEQGTWVYRTGLTMSSRSAQRARREIEQYLATLDTALNPFVVVGPDARGKFQVHGPDGPDGPVRNNQGYPRSFGDRSAARRCANSSGRGSGDVTATDDA